MCVIFFATNFAGYKLVVAANRDEFLDRPTKEAHYWELYPDVLAGIDLGHKQGNFQKYFGKKPQEVILSEEIENDSESELQTQLDKPPVNGHSVDDDLGHGTWLGISRTGRFAFITNFREHISTISPTAASRGYIVRDFLINSDEGDSSKSYSEKFITNLLEHRSDYNGFNIVVGEIGKETWYLGNRGDALKEGGRKLTEGIVHGFSNDILRQEGSEGWPKVEKGKGLFEDAINTSTDSNTLIDRLFNLLSDETTFPEHLIPINFSQELELALCSICIPRNREGLPSSNYATRTQTVILVDSNDNVRFVERNLTHSGVKDIYRTQYSAMYEIPTKYIPLPPIRKGEEDYQQRQLVKTTTDQTISLHEPTVTCSCPFQCNCHNNTPLIPNYHATDGMFTAPPSYESTKTIINSAISEYAEKRDISEKLAKTEIFQGYLFGRVLQGEKVANELAERVSQYNGIQDQLVRDTKVLEDGLKDNQMMNVSLINDERLLQRSLENILSVTKSLQDQLNQIHSTQSTHSSVISNHTEILTSIRSQSKSHFTQLESHHEQILTHQSQLQSQATSISTLNSNINNQLTNLASQSQTAINNILKHQKSELDKVDAKIRDMQTHLKRVENGTNSLYPEIIRLDSDFSAMKKNVEDRFYHYQHKVAEGFKTDFLQMNNDQMQRIGKLQDDIVQIKKIVRDLNASKDCEIQKLKELVFGIQNFIKAAREEETASVLELRKEIEVMRLESERIKKELFTEIRRISKPVFVM